MVFYKYLESSWSLHSNFAQTSMSVANFEDAWKVAFMILTAQ